MNKKLNLTSNPIGRLLKQIAIPASTGSLFQTLFNIIDTFYSGKISPESLAALYIGKFFLRRSIVATNSL